MKNAADKILSKGWVILFILFSVLAFYLAGINVFRFNVDNYFMFAHAKEILENGFPHTDVFSMHEGLHFMTPQWLYAVVVYLLKTYLGNTSVLWFAVIVFGLYVFMWYKTALLISSGNKDVSIFLTVICCGALGALFLKPRPFMVSTLLSILEVYILERYKITKDKKTILYSFLISVACINFHNSLWIFLYLIHLCYIGEWVVNKIMGWRTDYDIVDIMSITCASLLGGLLNPYGPEAITYIFSSMESIAPFKNGISELFYTTPQNGIIQYCILIPSIVVLIKKIKTIKPRYVFMFLGTMIMMLGARRNSIQFLSIGMLFLPAALHSHQFRHIDIQLLKYLSALITVIWICYTAIFVRVPEYIEDNKGHLYEATDWLSENADPGSSVYCSLDSGSYLIYKGFKPYIDGRLEVYGKANNGKEDIGAEFVNLINNNYENFSELVDKYDFDYIFYTERNFEAGLLEWLTENEDKYRKVYEDEYGSVWEKIDPEAINEEESETESKEEETINSDTFKKVDYSKVPCYVNGVETNVAECIGMGTYVVYIGRESCHTCESDSPKLIQAARESGAEVISMEVLDDTATEAPKNKIYIKRSYVRAIEITDVPAFIVFYDKKPQSLIMGGMEIRLDLEAAIEGAVREA